MHRKTYEQIIIVFCDNCHFNSSFEPSEEAYYDMDKSWEEFGANYKMVHVKSAKKLHKKVITKTQ